MCLSLCLSVCLCVCDRTGIPRLTLRRWDRSHRIGQNKPVTVYRMVCRHTVEERILNRAQVKFNIQKNVYAGGFKLQKDKEQKELSGAAHKHTHRADGQDEVDDEAEQEDGSAERRAAASLHGQQDDEAAESAIDPATLFKSNELRELMLAEDDEQAWDTDYFHSAAGRGRDRLARGDSYGEDMAVEHDVDLADPTEHRADGKAVNTSHSNKLATAASNNSDCIWQWDRQNTAAPASAAAPAGATAASTSQQAATSPQAASPTNEGRASGGGATAEKRGEGSRQGG